MECPTCKNDAPKVSYPWNGPAYCRYCPTKPKSADPAYLHRVRKTIGGRMTEADARHIVSRMKRRRD